MDMGRAGKVALEKLHLDFLQVLSDQLGLRFIASRLSHHLLNATGFVFGEDVGRRGDGERHDILTALRDLSLPLRFSHHLHVGCVVHALHAVG